jgi:hypothetical protein
MVGLPGFRFDYTPNPSHLTRRERRRPGANLPKPSEVFFNSGEIAVTDFLSIQARNLFNPGTIAADIRGRVRISATNGLADLSRGAIHVGDLPLPFCSSPTNFVSGPFFFFGDPTVRYDYLSSGVSGSVGTNRFPLPIDQVTLGTNFSPNFLPPFPRPPFSEFRQTLGTNLFTNFLTTVESCGQFDAFVFAQTNILSTTIPGLFRTNREVRVVFVPTNGLSTNVSVRIGFPTNGFGFFGGALAPIVEFQAAFFDVIQQRQTTNFITFRDDGASIFRGHDCQLDSSPGSNTPFNTGLFYSTNYVTNLVDYFYTVASAQVGTTNSIYFTNAPVTPRSPANTMNSASELMSVTWP